MSAITDLERRVELIERKLHVWRNIACSACLFVLFALVWSGLGYSSPGQDELVAKSEILPLTKQSNAIQTRQLQIINDSNEIVCLIGSQGNGGLIQMSNSTGNPTVQLGSTGSNGGSLFLMDHAGETQAELGSFFGGTLSLKRDGVTRTSLSGSGSIRLKDNEGGTRFFAGTDFNGNGRMSLSYQSGRSMWALDANDNGSEMTLGISTGKTVFQVSSTVSGGSMTVSNSEGTPAFTAQAGENGGALAVRSSQGNVVGGLLANSAGSASLGIVSSDGNGLITAAGTAESKGILIVSDPAGSNFVVDGGIMTIKDVNNDIALSAAADENGGGILKVLSPGLKQLVSAGSDSAGNGIVVTRSKDGEILWRSDQVTGSSTNGLLGDLDSDGDVDFEDFLTFAKNFGKSLMSG